MHHSISTDARAVITALGIWSCVLLSHAQQTRTPLMVDTTSIGIASQAPSITNTSDPLNTSPSFFQQKSNLLSLSQLYQKSIPLEARLRVADASVRAAEAQIDMARAQQRPSLSLSASRLDNRLNSSALNFVGQTTSTQDRYASYNQTLTLRQPLYRPALTAGIQSAQSQALAADLQKELETSTLAAYASAAYFDLLLAQSQQVWAAAQVKTQRILLEATSHAYAAGNGTTTEVEDAQSRLDLALADQADSLVYLSMSRQQIRLLLGGEDVQAVEPTQPNLLTGLLGSIDLQPQHWIDQALANNTEIRLLKMRLQAAQTEIRRAQAGHLPTLDLLLQRSRSGNENITRINSSYDNTSFGLQLNVPLYAGGYVSAQVRQAVAEYDKATFALDVTRSELSTRAFKEFRQMVDNLARYSALQKSIDSARTALRSAQMSQQAGIKSKLDVAQAAMRLVSSEHESRKVSYQALLANLRLNLMLTESSDAIKEAMDRLENWMYPPGSRTPQVNP